MFGKDVHLLKPEDLNAKDKMNYASCERLCQPHVRKLLKQHVSSIFLPLITVNNATFFVRIDSEGKQFYLKLMQFVASSYLDKQLHPEERIYRIWFVVFSMGLWLLDLLRKNVHTLREFCNFGLLPFG